MIVLGIDTSDYANAIGVVDSKSVLANFTFEARSDSLERIIADIAFTLSSAGLTLEDVQGIGVGLGPGSWTGIRVGVTVAKILAFSSDKPVAGIPTLEALAYAAHDEAGLISSIISVGAGDSVYAACYIPKDDNIIQLGEYYVGDLPGLTSMIDKPAVLVGPEAEKYSLAISRGLDKTGISLKAVMATPDGAIIARLASGRMESGNSDDALALTPLYLKESTAKAFINKYSNATVRN